jgi:hypothetical protein
MPKVKHLKFFGFAVIIALVMALLEIQIEGKNGWARSLPTWRLSVAMPVVGMWGGAEKQITGYHLYLWLFTLLLGHSAFLWTKWSLKKEAEVISFYIFYTALEGLLWFALNPAFGWQSFRYGRIAWYKELWVLGLPAEYWLRIALGAGLYWWANRHETITD